MHVPILVLVLSALIFGNASAFFDFITLRTREPIKITPKSRHNIPNNYITQRLDHFNPRDNRTWQMRYLSNDEFFKPGGPIMLYIGGEWTINDGSLMGGQVYDMAKQHSGYMFYTEHRFYGFSRPTEDTSVESLQFLNVDQALADLAYFVKHIKKTIPGLEHSKVVAIGGSYAGSMAAWFRLKYPHLADMALASSAPMVAVADFKEYLEVVGTAMSSLSGMRCYEVVQKATQQIRKAFQGLAGVEVVAKTFNLCPPIEPDSPLDFANFFSTIANAFSGTVQYHEPGDVESVCRFLNAEASNSSEMATLAKFLRTKWGNRCVNLKFQPIVNFLRNDSWMHQASVGGLRQWIYQTCTEYGYFQTDKSIKQPFGNGANTLKYYEALCDQTYGHGFIGSSNQVLHNGINRTNIVYGGLKPKLTKVIFTHGTIDPWHAIGVLQDLNEDTPTIIVTGTSHCQDLESISEKDLPQMKAAKLRVQQLISKWLSE